MKERLLPENLLAFNERFRVFHDAVIHNVKIDLFSKTEPTRIQITVGTRDFYHEENNQWVNIVFDIDGVTKFCLNQERRYLVSIVFRLNIGFFGDEIYLDFNPSKDNPNSAADFEERKDPKNAVFLVIGKACYWYTSPYTERTGE